LEYTLEYTLWLGCLCTLLDSVGHYIQVFQ